MAILADVSFDSYWLATLDEAVEVSPSKPTKEQVTFVRDALLSNIRCARIEFLNQAIRLDNELATEERLSMREKLDDLERRVGFGEK